MHIMPFLVVILFIKGLKEADFEESDKVMMMAEARAIRAWFYMFLTQSWGRVPMLDEEDTYATAPNKPRAENEAAMWDFIIADLQYAADNLTWAPRNNEAGRVTKGMATAYLVPKPICGKPINIVPIMPHTIHLQLLMNQ